MTSKSAEKHTHTHMYTAEALDLRQFLSLSFLFKCALAPSQTVPLVMASDAEI